jgi:hypothetical protein
MVRPSWEESKDFSTGPQPKSHLIERAGSLSARNLRELDDALQFALGLDG